jgi:YedE family putative selenium metabolism protein
MKIIPKELYALSITGLILGAIGIVLISLGNPEHVGICISCYITNFAGSLGLHSNPLAQFPRPELIGILIGAYLLSLIRKQHHSRPTGDFMVRFIIGFIFMVGCAVFVGCPLRALFRLGFGDFSVLIGIAGFAVGVGFAATFEKAGFSLKGVLKDEKEKGSWILPLIGLIIFIALASGGAGLKLSVKGSGAVHAPIFMSLLFGMIMGALGQRSRYCTTAGIKNFLIGRDPHILIGSIMVVVSASLMNIIYGKYMVGFINYPGANVEYIWDFISMFLVGMGAVFVDGCPFRIIVRAGQGDSETLPVLMGMILAGGMTETLNIVSISEGITGQGKISVLAGILTLVFIGLSRIRRQKVEQSIL